MSYDPDDLMDEARKRRTNGDGVRHEAKGGRLDAEDRAALPSSDFALPGRRYPLSDANHARNALARAAQHASPAEQATIKRKVHAKYPGIAIDDD